MSGSPWIAKGSGDALAVPEKARISDRPWPLRAPDNLAMLKRHNVQTSRQEKTPKPSPDRKQTTWRLSHPWQVYSNLARL